MSAFAPNRVGEMSHSSLNDFYYKKDWEGKTGLQHQSENMHRAMYPTASEKKFNENFIKPLLYHPSTGAPCEHKLVRIMLVDTPVVVIPTVLILGPAALPVAAVAGITYGIAREAGLMKECVIL